MKFKDIVHLYIGCEMNTPNGVGIFKKYDLCENICLVDFGIMGPEYESFDISDVKPILRSLDSMTDEELHTWEFSGGLVTGTASMIWCEANRTALLLKNGFDIFFLIESGEAINKSNSNEQTR